MKLRQNRLIADQDDSLFAAVLANDQRVLRFILPDGNNHSYSLIGKSYKTVWINIHKLLLATKGDPRNVAERLLIKHMYCFNTCIDLSTLRLRLSNVFLKDQSEVKRKKKTDAAWSPFTPSGQETGRVYSLMPGWRILLRILPGCVSIWRVLQDKR